MKIVILSSRFDNVKQIIEKLGDKEIGVIIGSDAASFQQFDKKKSMLAYLPLYDPEYLGKFLLHNDIDLVVMDHFNEKIKSYMLAPVTGKVLNIETREEDNLVKTTVSILDNKDFAQMIFEIPQTAKDDPGLLVVLKKIMEAKLYPAAIRSFLLNETLDYLSIIDELYKEFNRLDCNTRIFRTDLEKAKPLE